ncbi:hypothetical protein E4U25_003610 [Claviceps purpurea]|nr:hypothetical protein E4U25_003610 [Claviceps purpurea]
MNMESTFDDAKLLSYTDSDLVKHLRVLPWPTSIVRAVPLSDKYFAKGYAKWYEVEDAVSAMKFASQLGIHVPHIQRIVKDDDGFCCIMDRIPGTTLDIAWHELGWIASLRLAFQMRRIVLRLRSAMSTSSGSPRKGECTSYFLDDRFNLPLRASGHHMNAFLNFWANFAGLGREIKKTPAEHAICRRPIFTDSRPFVFTHHDLAPRNIILDPEGQLHVIDWDLAGFYPEFFENCATQEPMYFHVDQRLTGGNSLLSSHPKCDNPIVYAGVQQPLSGPSIAASLGLRVTRASVTMVGTGQLVDLFQELRDKPIQHCQRSKLEASLEASKEAELPGLDNLPPFFRTLAAQPGEPDVAAAISPVLCASDDSKDNSNHDAGPNDIVGTFESLFYTGETEEGIQDITSRTRQLAAVFCKDKEYEGLRRLEEDHLLKSLAAVRSIGWCKERRKRMFNRA